MHFNFATEIELTEEYQGSALIVKITGRLDAISAPQVDKKVSGLIDMENKYILMDFSGVDYLSSAGMRLLLSATKRLKSQNGKFIICNIIVIHIYSFLIQRAI